MKPGDKVYLKENDCFYTKSLVTIVKIHKGGNVIVKEADGKLRECAAHNLEPTEGVKL